MVDNTNHLYLRNKTTSLLPQWNWDYGDVSKDLNVGPRSVGALVTYGGFIATTMDTKSTDYLFFQSDGGTVANGLSVGESMSNFTAGVSNL